MNTGEIMQVPNNWTNFVIIRTFCSFFNTFLNFDSITIINSNDIKFPDVIIKSIKSEGCKIHVDRPLNLITYSGTTEQIQKATQYIDSIYLVSRLKVALDSEIVDTRIPIRKLKKATDKKQIYINVLPFDYTSFGDKKKTIKTNQKKWFKY